ncbi:MAG: GNAT family N-acetyltransferase [Oligoflexus sp.]
MEMGPLKSASHLQQRNRLLQQTLRPTNLPFSIQTEYPIVLDTKNNQLSHGLIIDDKLIAHANLWPRNLIDSRGHTISRVGLVGNVATHPEWQGRGLMAKLFQYLEAVAQDQGLEALILWSDLVQFYQKLGFQSLGEEWLFQFSNELGNTRTPSNISLDFPVQRSLNHEELQKLLRLRPEVPTTLERSPVEFAQLLEIPSCDLCLLTVDGEVQAYTILGKGYDMMGVVHEWGSESADFLEVCLGHILQFHQFDKIYLLSPYYIAENWLSFYHSKAISKQKLAMALVKPLSISWKHRELAERGFIWGLDSI